MPWSDFVELFHKNLMSAILVSQNNETAASWRPKQFLMKDPTFLNKFGYYLLKIFRRFLLAKITRIIHHNQLLLIKLGIFFFILNR